MSLRNAFGLLAIFAAVAGCGGDNSPAPTPTPTPTPADMAKTPTPTPTGDMAMATGGNGSTGKISGKVTYAGTNMGTLKFALYDQMPGPTTPPKYYMFPTVDNPTFPYAYTLDNVVPGAYWVVSILDVPPASPAIPGPEDAVGTSMGQVTVTAGGTGMIDVALPN